MATMIKCPFCGGLVDEASNSCIHCGGPLHAKGVQPKVSRAAVLCPSCSAPVGPGDIVCVKCGTNLLTGQKVAEEKEKATQPRFAAAARVFSIIFAVLALLVIAGVVAALVVYLMRDPVGEARRLARAGNLAEASDVLQGHLQNAPGDIDAQFLLGQIYWQGQQYNRAAEVFESVARQGGAQERDALILAVLAAERSPEAANRQRLLTLIATAVQQRHPHDAELRKLLALLRGVEGEYRGQHEAVQEALLMGSDLSPVLPGLALVLDDNLDGAEQALDRARQEGADRVEVIIARAMVHLLRGQEDEAAALLESAGESTPELDGLVKLQLGLLHMQAGRFGRALPLLTDAKRLRPEDARADFFHALCLQENRLLEEALSAYERIASGTGAYAGLASLQMAIAFLDQDNLDRATAMARRASEAGVNTARQATVQGRIFARQNDMGQAEQAYRRAISMTADYPAARLELGLLLIHRGAIEAGLQELEYYLELAREDGQRMRANEIEVLVTQIRQTRQ